MKTNEIAAPKFFNAIAIERARRIEIMARVHGDWIRTDMRGPAHCDCSRCLLPSPPLGV